MQKNYIQYLWSYAISICMGLQSAANLRMLRLNLFYFRFFLSCIIVRLHQKHRPFSSNSLSFLFSVKKKMLPFIFPKTSLWAWTLNCLFPNTLKYDNVISHQVKEDTQPPENTVSFCAIHGFWLEKNYCFFHLMSTVAKHNMNWPRKMHQCIIVHLALTLQEPSSLQQWSHNTYFMVWIDDIRVSAVIVQFQVSFLYNEGNCDFCFQG